MSDSEMFDTDLFIEEVHNDPILWDYRKEEYFDRSLKNKAWETISRKFYEDYDTMEEQEKNKCVVQLQRKWRSLRDSFNRDLKKHNTWKSGTSKRYYYYSQLSFLKALSENKKKNKDDEIKQIADEREVTEISDSEVLKRRRTFKRTKQAKSMLFKKRIIHSNNRLHTQKDDPTKACDSDMHFLLSLYERFKNIREDLKVSAQIEMLNVIQKYSTPASIRNDDHFDQGHRQYKRPSTSRCMQDLRRPSGPEEPSSFPTGVIPKEMSDPDSPPSVTSQASVKNDPIATDMIDSDNN